MMTTNMMNYRRMTSNINSLSNVNNVSQETRGQREEDEEEEDEEEEEEEDNGRGEEEKKNDSMLFPDPLLLNTKKYGNFLKVSPSKTEVTYVGSGRHSNDVGAIQSEYPVPTNRLIYYYELRVLDAGRSGCIAIGFTDGIAKLSRQPGWEPNSYGYHGDDGHKFHGNGSGEVYGPTFTTGDVVGAGIHLEKGEVFFTKNGQWLGVAFYNVCRVSLFPTIGLHSKGERVQVNFGSSTFLYNVDEAITQEKKEMQRLYRISNINIMDCHLLVRNYLEYFGYIRTLDSFDKLDNRSKSNDTDSDYYGKKPIQMDPRGADISTHLNEASTSERGQTSHVLTEASNMDKISKLRDLIMTGHAREALDTVDRLFPGLSKDESGMPGKVFFALKLQEFIEVLRQGDVLRGLKIAREELTPLRGRDPVRDAAMDEAFVLFAFSDPMRSTAQGVRALLTPQTRDMVADVVIMAMKDRLKMKAGVEATCSEKDEDKLMEVTGDVTEPLQKLLMHLCVVMREIRASNGFQGEIFHLSECINNDIR